MIHLLTVVVVFIVTFTVSYLVARRCMASAPSPVVWTDARAYRPSAPCAIHARPIDRCWQEHEEKVQPEVLPPTLAELRQLQIDTNRQAAERSRYDTAHSAYAQAYARVQAGQPLVYKVGEETATGRLLQQAYDQERIAREHGMPIKRTNRAKRAAQGALEGFIGNGRRLQL